MTSDDVCRSRSLHPVGGRRVRPVGGRLVYGAAYWLIRPGPARPAWLKAAAARFRTLQAWAGHIVAASRTTFMGCDLGGRKRC